MLWRSSPSIFLIIAVSSLLPEQQVGAARHLQVLPGKPALQRHARWLLLSSAGPDPTLASGVVNTNAVSSTASAGTTTGGTNSLLGGASNLGGSLGVGSGESSGGSLLKAVQSGSISSSPPPLGLTGVSSPPPSDALPQLNWNPSGTGFNSGNGRRMHAHA